MVDIPINSKGRSKAKLVVIAFLAFSFLALWLVAKGCATTPRISKDEVTVVSPKRETLTLEVEGTGRVKPVHSRLIVAEVSGNAVEIKQRPGSLLEEGDVVLVLENRTLKEELREMKDDLKAKKNEHAIRELEHLEKRTGYVGRMDRSRSEYESERSTFKAYENLMKTPYPPVSELEYEDAERAYKVSKNEFMNSKNNLKNYERMEKAKVSQMKMEIDGLERRIEKLSEKVENLTIKAQDKSVIQTLDVELGQSVEAGNSVGRIYTPGVFYAEIEVSASSASRISEGMPAVVEVSGRQIDGTVSRVDPTVEGAHTTVDIKLSIDDPDWMQVNRFARASIKIEQKENVLAMQAPEGVNGHDKAMVYVMDDERNGYATYREVEFGGVSGDVIEVVSGLSVTDEVIITKIDKASRSSEGVFIK